jgi:hypothetical protein
MELFSSLYENTKHSITPLDDSKKRYVVSTIPQLDERGHEILFFLIRMYHIQQTRDINFNLPYQTAVSTEGINCDLESFPLQLQHMIYLFTSMHENYIKSERNRTQSV